MFLVKATECLVGLGCGFNDVGGSDASLRRLQVGCRFWDDGESGP